MTSMNSGSIAAYVRNSIDQIPATVDSGTNIVDWINFAAQRVANAVGEVVNTDDIPAKFQPVLFDWGRVMCLSKMIGVGVDFSVSLGEFSVSKAEGSSPEFTQMRASMDNVKAELKALGQQMPFAMVRG